MQIYNMMTGQGFSTSIGGTLSMAWLGAVILFFIIAFTRKWIGEEMDIPYDFIISAVLGFLAYFITIGFTGSFKWAELAGIVFAAAGGFGAPYFMGGGSE